MSKTIRIAVEGKFSLPIAKLEPFQGTLKTLAKEQYEKIRQEILDEGFSFVVHVWQHEGHNYIIDGHQRIFTLNQLAKIEDYNIPDIPVAIVHASSFKSAKRKVLAGASQYGRVNKKGLYDFMTENQLSLEEVARNFDFQEIDFGDFGDEYFKSLGEQLPEPDSFDGQMQSASGEVRQVQLLFNSKSHEEFMGYVKFLAAKFSTENITDTVLKALRAHYKSY